MKSNLAEEKKKLTTQLKLLSRETMLSRLFPLFSLSLFDFLFLHAALHAVCRRGNHYHSIRIPFPSQ